jgi:hypothetical protein
MKQLYLCLTRAVCLSLLAAPLIAEEDNPAEEAVVNEAAASEADVKAESEKRVEKKRPRKRRAKRDMSRMRDDIERLKDARQSIPRY